MLLFFDRLSSLKTFFDLVNVEINFRSFRMLE
jgi:hypothetical protein